MKQDITEQMEALASSLLEEVKEAYKNEDEVELYRALERLKIGAEAMSKLIEVDEYIKGAK